MSKYKFSLMSLTLFGYIFTGLFTGPLSYASDCQYIDVQTNTCLNVYRSNVSSINNDYPNSIYGLQSLGPQHIYNSSQNSTYYGNSSNRLTSYGQQSAQPRSQQVPYGYAITGQQPQSSYPQTRNSYPSAPYYQGSRPSMRYPSIDSGANNLGIDMPRMRSNAFTGSSYSEVRGRLYLIDGCIYLKPERNHPASQLYTVVWPPHTTIRRVGNGMISINEQTLASSSTMLGHLTSFGGGLGLKPYKHDRSLHQPSYLNKCRPYPTALVGSWSRL